MPTNQITQTQENVDSLRLLQNILEANRLTNPDITFQLLRQGIAERQQQASRQTLSKLLSGEITPAEAALTSNIPAGSLLAHQRAGERNVSRGRGQAVSGLDAVLPSLSAAYAEGRISKNDLTNIVIELGGTTKDIRDVISTGDDIKDTDNNIAKTAADIAVKLNEGNSAGVIAGITKLEGLVKGQAEKRGLDPINFIVESGILPGIAGDLIAAIRGMADDEVGIRKLYERVNNKAAKQLIGSVAPQISRRFESQDDFIDNQARIEQLAIREIQPSMLQILSQLPIVLGEMGQQIPTRRGLLAAPLTQEEEIEDFTMSPAAARKLIRESQNRSIADVF